MVQSRQVKGSGSARTEGARRATGVRADAAAVGSGALAPGQRWSASRKRDVVLRLLRGESFDVVSRDVGVELYRLEAWKGRALAGLELGLKDQAGEPVAAALDAAKRHIGELSMENELLRERARARRSVASLCRCGGRDDERNDPPRPRGGAMGSSGCVGYGTGRARRSTRGGLVRGGWSGVHARRAAGRRPRCRMRSCWRPFAATWPAHRSRARAIARSTRGCGSWTGSALPGRGCCA